MLETVFGPTLTLSTGKVTPVHADFNLDLCQLGQAAMRAHLAHQLAPADLDRFASDNSGSGPAPL